jgi:hypothetical protein
MKALLFVPLLILAQPASAAEAPSKPSSAPFVDLQPVGLPAVVHGRLVNYIFVDIRLRLGRGVDPTRLQDQEPYLRDAVIRAATRTPFNPPEDGLRIDHNRLQAEVLHDAQAQFGPGKVVGIDIRSETPQRRTGVPGRQPG